MKTQSLLAVSSGALSGVAIAAALTFAAPAAHAQGRPEVPSPNAYAQWGGPGWRDPGPRAYRGRAYYRDVRPGWRRYHARPWNWRARGCYLAGPVWICR